MADEDLVLENVEDAFPLTASQAGMLFHSLAAPEGGVYLGVIEAVLPADVDLAALRTAWADVIARHQTLRTQFVWDGLDAPVQVVRAAADLEWEDAGHLLPEAWLDGLWRRGVDLDRAPAMRLALLARPDGRWHFAWVCHHALLDDWSAGVVLREVASLYAERTGGPSAALRPAMPFRDYVDWLASRELMPAEGHWRRVLGDFRAPSRIPEYGADGCPGRDRVETGLSPDATARLGDAARRLRVSLADVIATAWGVVLHRLSGQDDVVFGQATTLRPPELRGIEEAVGNFITALPVRLRLDRQPTLGGLIHERHAAGLEDRGHGAIPLARLQELSGLPPSVPLFDTILSMEKPPPSNIEVGGRVLFQAIAASDRSNYPLAVLIYPGERLTIRLQFDRLRHATEMMHRVARMLKTALTALPDSLHGSPFDLDVISTAELERATAGLSSPVPVPPTRLVHDEFAAVAARIPDALALIGPGAALSYSEVDRRSAAWAGVLASRGLGPGSRVALLVEWGVLAPLAMLAALRAGCSYVPFDTRHNSERTIEILQTSGFDMIFADAEGAASLSGSSPPVLRIDQRPEDSRITPAPPGPDDIAYVMYTSGSTGVPNAVAVTHANLAYSTAARRAFYESPPRAFLLLSAFAFDSSVAGLYWTLSTGGTLVVPGAAALGSISALSNMTRSARVTHMLGLPSLLDQVATHAPSDALASLEVVIAAGEPLTTATVERCRRAFPHARLYNEYGPTEATVWCAACEVTAHQGASVPIGGPIPGSRLLIRDARGRPVPDGVAGELFVGGPGISAGYCNKPDPRGERFVKAADGTWLYQTGDLVRMRPDGLLDYLGRGDDQVKIRGYRVEPAEIEAVLAARPDVREAAIVPVRSELGTWLIAFVVAETGPAPDRDVLRDHLRQRLPGWMVPQRIDLLDSLPRTATGKVDRKALTPTLEVDKAEITGPRTPLEYDLAVIWRTILGLNRDVGIDEDFRELGGNSLLSIRLVAEIETSLKVRLPLALLGDITTIAEQAALIETAASRIPSSWSRIEPAKIDQAHPFAGLTADELRHMHGYLAGWPGERAFGGSLFFQLNAGGSLPPLFWCFNGGHEFAALADALGPDQPVFGLRTGNLIMDMSPALQQRNSRRIAVQALPELLRLKAEGTVFLGGNCQGAAVAMELALMLQSLGRNVGVVFLMEAIPMHAFHGRVALIFGRESEYNPFARFAAPELAWSRRYLRHSVDIIAGRHGSFFKVPNVRQLAAAVSLRLSEARSDTPTYLDRTDRRAAFTAPTALEPFAPGEPRVLRVGVRNLAGIAWQPTCDSGLRLAARWVERDGTASHAGAAEIDAIWPPGEARELALQVTAPLRPGEIRLEIDVVEEGVVRFAEQQGAPLHLNVLVEGTQRMQPTDPGEYPPELGRNSAATVPTVPLGTARPATLNGYAEYAGTLGPGEAGPGARG